MQELTALYALGSLSQREAHGFELHLQEGCASCEADLRRFEITLTGIGLDTEEAGPPEYLRDLLSARIDRTAGAETVRSACRRKRRASHEAGFRKTGSGPAGLCRSPPTADGFSSLGRGGSPGGCRRACLPCL